MARAKPGLFDVSALGDAKLQATIHALEPSIVKPALRVALRDAFKITHRAVLTRVPVDTGRMRRAIKLRAANQLRGDVAFRIFLPRRAELGARWIKRPGSRGGSSVPGYYPAAVEFGYTREYKGPATTTVTETRRTSRQGLYKTYTYQRPSRSKRLAVKVPPRSFMRSALHGTAEQVKTRVRRMLWTEIRAKLRERVGAS